MSYQDTQEGEGELDPRRCQHVTDGVQCKAWKMPNGFCAGHARSRGLLVPKEVEPDAQNNAGLGITEAAAALAAAQERAQASLSLRAAAWLSKPSTQRDLERRWNETVRSGSDSDLYRLLKDMLDRTEGRPGEQHKAEPVEEPASLAAVRAMTREQRRAFIRRTAPS